MGFLSLSLKIKYYIVDLLRPVPGHNVTFTCIRETLHVKLHSKKCLTMSDSRSWLPALSLPLQQLSARRSTELWQNTRLYVCMASDADNEKQLPPQSACTHIGNCLQIAWLDGIVGVARNRSYFPADDSSSSIGLARVLETRLNTRRDLTTVVTFRDDNTDCCVTD